MITFEDAKVAVEKIFDKLYPVAWGTPNAQTRAILIDMLTHSFIQGYRLGKEGK